MNKKTPGTINFAKQIKLITQKMSSNIRSIYKNVLESLSEVLEDDKRFYAYFEKKFPKSFKYLPIIKFGIFFLYL